MYIEVQSPDIGVTYVSSQFRAVTVQKHPIQRIMSPQGEIFLSAHPPASLSSPPWRVPQTLMRANDVNKVRYDSKTLKKMVSTLSLGNLIKAYY